MHASIEHTYLFQGQHTYLFLEQGYIIRLLYLDIMICIFLTKCAHYSVEVVEHVAHTTDKILP